MKRSFVLWVGLLEKLTGDDSKVNIILGTGTLARDMQTKLKLLNLKAPILVGDREDAENGIWHYENLTRIKNPNDYLFIVCFDTDEWDLFSPVLSVVYKLLGVTMWHHHNVMKFYDIWREKVGKYFIDTHIQETYLHNDRPYVVLGDVNDKKAFKIHFFGACSVSGIFKVSKGVIPELLYDKLCMSGFNATIYIWGHPSRTTYDNLVLFLREGYLYKPDHVILFTAADSYASPINVVKKNALPVRTGHQRHIATDKIMHTYTEKISNGIHHDVELSFISSVHNTTFLALAKFFGFSFWNIIPPASHLISESQARQLLGLSPGYLRRARRRKDDLISALNSSCVRDYTNIFDAEDDIFSLYGDKQHYTDKGCDIIAQKLADDIILEFSSYYN